MAQALFLAEGMKHEWVLYSEKLESAEFRTFGQEGWAFEPNPVFFEGVSPGVIGGAHYIQGFPGAVGHEKVDETTTANIDEIPAMVLNTLFIFPIPSIPLLADLHKPCLDGFPGLVG